VNTLDSHPFLLGIPPAKLASLAPCARPTAYEPDTLLFRTGEPADAFYLITAGRVALEIPAPGGPPLMVETVDAGGVVGWSWLVPPYRWQFDARAVTPVSTIRLPADCLRAAMAADLELAAELLRRVTEVIADRLRNTRLQLLDVYGHARR
jgi:CRP/FNR family transcriptional regulator, cyclic AMP receptor protein